MRWHSHISAEDCQYVWAVVDIDFFVQFVSRAEMVAFFFVGEGSQTRPQCAAVHSSFDTEKKNCSFPQNSGAQFFFIRSVFKKCRCRRFDSCKLGKSSPRADRERESDYLSQETAERIELTSLWFHFWSHPMLPLSSGYHRPTHFQIRPNQLLKRETERLFEGIMIDHEQLNPLVRWRSLTLLSPHRE